MKINDVLLTEAGWADYLKGAVNKIFDLAGEKEIDIDQAATMGAKELQQSWARMVNNLRSHYDKIDEKNLREQLLGFLHKTGVEFWPYNGSQRREQFTLVAKNNKPEAGAFSKLVFDSFNTIISETLAGRETGGAVQQALVNTFKEAVNTQQRNQFGVQRKDSKASPANSNIRFKPEDFGARLSGRLAPLNTETDTDNYENAVLPIKYLKTALEDANGNIVRRTYVLVNGTWMVDVNGSDDVDSWTLQPMEGNTTIIASMLKNISASVSAETLDLHDLVSPYTSAKGSQQALMRRVGTSREDYRLISREEGLQYTYGGNETK